MENIKIGTLECRIGTFEISSLNWSEYWICWSLALLHHFRLQRVL